MDGREENYSDFLSCIKEKKTWADYNPPELMIALTNVCNLHCAFCAFCGFCSQKIEKPEMLSPDLLQELKPFLRTAKFLNPSARGEPFLYSHLDEFLNISRETGSLSVTQLTNNGTQLQKHDLRKLEGIGVVAVSFDSADKKILEILRCGADFEQILENMTKLRKELPNTPLQMCVVVNRLNLAELPELYQIARKKGFNYITYNTVYGPSEDKVIQLLRLRESDRPLFEEKMRKVREMNSDGRLVINNVATFDGFEDNAPLNREAIYQSLVELKKQKPYLNYDEPNPSALAMRRVKKERRSFPAGGPVGKQIPYCTNPWAVFDVFPNGDVCPCCANFGPIDNLTGKTLDEVWNGQAYRDLRESMFDYAMLPDYCKKCKAFVRYDYVDGLFGGMTQEAAADLIVPPHYYPGDAIKDPVLKARIISVNRNREQNTLKKQAKVRPAETQAINSRPYWEDRFATDDWNQYGGDKQSEFFAQVGVDAFPVWLKEEIDRNEWNILDVGCAEGDGSAIFARNFPTAHVVGMDFSGIAVKKAKEKFPSCDFIEGDATAPIEPTDIVFSSNTLEHLKNPRSIMQNICNAAEKYAVLLLPFEDHLRIKEHINIFFRDFFPLQIGQCYLKFYTVIDCTSMKATYWPGKQILLIYANENYQPMNQMSAETIYRNYTQPYETKLEYLSAKVGQQEASLKTQEENIRLKEANIKAKEAVIREKEANIKKLEIAVPGLNANVEALTAHLDSMNKRADSLQRERDKLSQENSGLQARNKNLTGRLTSCRDAIRLARELCYGLAATKLFRFVHFVSRLKRQWLHGSREEKKDFHKWLHLHCRHVPDTNHQYNPIFGVIGILDSAASAAADALPKYTDGQVQGWQESAEDIARRNILVQPYKSFDVIILSVIDYDFRRQRPQHFAQRFAANGHRVFYINANYHRENSVKQAGENLFVVNFKNESSNAVYYTDWSQSSRTLQQHFDWLLERNCIRDAVTIVDYPNWIRGAEYLRERYGFKFVTDYMDDYTGFLRTADETVRKNCAELLTKSDMVVASSQFLYDIAKKHNRNCAVVRNGSEYEHFHKAFGKKPESGRKVVGYYGAIAEWFDADKVCYAARHLPECDIVLIGEITAGREKLEQFPNIKLLGEMPYSDLPEQLKTFDVCLIPFDTKTNLIKATNPVKFYEYLSAGKKIVATEIPELAPYKDKYVYLANDNQRFLEDVRLCLSGGDSLAGPEECAALGRRNDWQERYDEFSKDCMDAVPKVSIIVLTYNNLELNQKCIRSILNKTAYPRYELILVDNFSTDGTREYLQKLDAEKIPNVRIILNGENKGFAGGNNIGIRAADGDYVLLLNNDTVVTRGWMTSLVKHGENSPMLGMCGPVTNSIGNEARIKVGYSDLNGLDGFAERYAWEHMGEEWKDPDRLALFCTLIKREVIEKCGFLDESYKVGMFEDDDYAEAVKKAGYGMAIAEDAFVHHFDGASFKKLDDKNYRTIFEANKAVFEKKWGVKWRMPLYRSGVTGDTNKDSGILQK